MTQGPTVLENIRIASPCTASWDAMVGDDKSRFCGQCKLNVYNLSAMSRTAAEALVRKKEGRLCVRFYQRADGTMITQDCPVGLAKLKKKLARLAGGLAAVITFAVGLGGCGKTDAGAGGSGSGTGTGKGTTTTTQPVQPVQPTKQDPQPLMGTPVPPPPPPKATMGEACVEPEKPPADGVNKEGAEKK